MSDPAVAPGATQTSRPRRRGCGKAVFFLVLLFLVVLGVVVLYSWIALRYSYSEGERAGYVQKFSKKGWVCKTWEGEIAMVNIPGTMPQIFNFSVRDDAVAEKINRTMGQRVTLHYEQHKGVPTSCFGETDYFVTEVRSLEGPGATPQLPPPQAPPATPAPQRPPG